MEQSARDYRVHAAAVAADGKGFPDLILVRDRLVVAELKSDGGGLSADQRDWRDWLLAAGQEWHCWRPSMWAEIERELR